MSSNSDGFAIALVSPGDINAMVKVIMKAMGIDDPNEAVWRIKVGQWVAVPATNPVPQVVDRYLEPIGKLIIDIDPSINCSTYLQTRNNELWIDENFQRLFGRGEAISFPPRVSLPKFVLKKDSFDVEIREELPKDHVFEAFEFRFLLASAIKKQVGGKKGVLRNDGRREIFYVRSADKKECFAVLVGWSSSRFWCVHVWELGYSRGAEDSVCSRN